MNNLHISVNHQLTEERGETRTHSSSLPEVSTFNYFEPTQSEGNKQNPRITRYGIPGTR